MESIILGSCPSTFAPNWMKITENWISTGHTTQILIHLLTKLQLFRIKTVIIIYGSMTYFLSNTSYFSIFSSSQQWIIKAVVFKYKCTPSGSMTLQTRVHHFTSVTLENWNMNILSLSMSTSCALRSRCIFKIWNCFRYTVSSNKENMSAKVIGRNQANHYTFQFS